MRLRGSAAARIAPALVAASVLVAPGCSDAPRSNSRRLELALKTSPSRLDPAFAVDVSGGEICAAIYQGLVRFNAAGKLVPALARRWTVDSSGLRYTFDLRAGVRFSDGRAVTSRDVVYSFNRVLSPSVASPRRWVLDRIRGAAQATLDSPADGLSAPDDSTVVVELDEPFSPFLSLLAMPAAMVVPEGTGLARNGRPASIGAAATGVTATGSGSDHGANRTEAARPAAAAPKRARGRERLPPGSGPWRLAEWKRGDFIELRVNPYSRRRAREIDAVRYRIIPESFTRVAEFESGSLDVLQIPPAEVGRFRHSVRPGVRLVDRDELRVVYIGLNTTRGPLRDERVRRALNMAVDVNRLIAVLEQGQGIRARGAVPPALAGYRERPGWPYDPRAARALLAAAGYPHGFAMEIWQRDSPEGNRLLEAVQGYLAAIQVRVKLVRREWSAFKEAVVAGRVDAFFLDWFADYPDAENFLYPLFHSDNVGGGGNRSFFRNAVVDSLIDRAAHTVQPGRRASLYARADSLVYTHAPWIYLLFPRSVWAIAPRVRGFSVPSIYTGGDLTGVSLDGDVSQ